MKSRFLVGLGAITCLAALTMPIRLAAQDKAEAGHKHHHYKLIDVGTLGGPQSFFQEAQRVLNNNGLFVGWADTAISGYPEFCFSPGDGFYAHAFQRQDSMLTDLGTLPGGNSSQAVWVSTNGLITGYSSNGQLDPLVFGLPEARAVLWREGQAVDLGTLGGNESAANAVNSRGQVVGMALNAIGDPYSFFDFALCGSSSGTQTRAFLWDPDNGMQDLGTLGTGTDAAAYFVNEAGQVAGFAYTNSIPNDTTGLPTFHPFLWDKKNGMRDLGSFGGTVVQNMNRLNQRGQIVGSLTLPGDAGWHPFVWDGKQLIDLGTYGGDQDYGNWINDAGEVTGQGAFPGLQEFHGFYWKDGKKTDLGVLPGDYYSDASVINSRSQIVGMSGNNESTSAVLWENGEIVDLNTLVAPGSGLGLYWARYINDRGEIAASGAEERTPFWEQPNGSSHDVLLIPCDAGHPSIEGCDYTMVDVGAGVPRNTHNGALPKSLMRQLNRHEGANRRPMQDAHPTRGRHQ